MAARKRKEQVGTSENNGGISINPALHELQDKLV
jgi:altronate dehydratase